MRQLEEFLDKLCLDIGRVEQKFVRAMVGGIFRARSINLTHVARALDEGISLHATHKRLSRNLNNSQLQGVLSQRLLQLGVESVDTDTRLIVHTYTLRKKYARKIEYFADGRDAGFKVCEVLASNMESERYVPLIVHVWSNTVPGFVSDAHEIKKILRRVRDATGGKGLVYFEDKAELTSRIVPEFMSDSEFEFIAFLEDDDLEVVCRGEPRALKDVLASIGTQYGKVMFKLVPEGVFGTSQTDMNVFIHVGARSIRTQESDRALSLIALKSNNTYLGKHTTPLITSRTSLRSREALMGLVESFLSIQNVLTTHATLRNEFRPASFRVLHYDRLQLLMTLLFAALQIESSIYWVAPPQFSVKPHDGDMDRTYLMPEQP